MSQMTVVGNRTIDICRLVIKLRKHCPLTEIVSTSHRKGAEPKKENAYEKPEKDDQKMVLEGKLSEIEAFSVEKLPQSIKGSGDSGSGANVTTAAGKSIARTVDMRNPNNDWYSFCVFLNSRLRPLTLSGCRAKDAIDFLRMWQTPGNLKALVGRLSAACEAYGIKSKDNPFRSLAVITYVHEAREKTRETECILVFSFNDSFDLEERSFIKAILKELHEREVAPLTYDLSGIENLDAEMFYRSSVGIVIVSNSFARSHQTLDRLVEIMEHWKAKDFVIIPVYFKFTLLDDQFDPLLLEHLSSVQPGRVQKWMAAVTEIGSMDDGYQWTKG